VTLTRRLRVSTPTLAFRLSREPCASAGLAGEEGVVVELEYAGLRGALEEGAPAVGVVGALLHLPRLRQLRDVGAVLQERLQACMTAFLHAR
jgi:hypothetical protein